MFLLVSSTHLIIAAILLSLLVFGSIYMFYKMMKFAVKNAIKETKEK